MQQLQIFQIDAFTKNVFSGNPAAVCPLEKWLDDTILQAIAQENNLAETAFFVPTEKGFHIRWFTPRHEVPLCGHATLASAFVIFTELEKELKSVRFESKSGPLIVTRKDLLLEMDFPAYQMIPCQNPPNLLLQGLKQHPKKIFIVEEDPNYYAVFETEEQVRALKPDLHLIEQLHPYAVVVTAPGKKTDCVSRYFAPSYGIDEDPVTGSIHSVLVPFWTNQLKKTKIHACQASQRGGDLFCKYTGKRVLIGGYAVKVMTGKFCI